MIGDTLSDEYSYSLHMSGCATTLPAEDEDEVIAALHAIVREVTGQPVEKPQPRRIGFV